MTICPAGDDNVPACRRIIREVAGGARAATTLENTHERHPTGHMDDLRADKTNRHGKNGSQAHEPDQRAYSPHAGEEERVEKSEDQSDKAFHLLVTVA
jgi:hypothetical protein